MGETSQIDRIGTHARIKKYRVSREIVMMQKNLPSIKNNIIKNIVYNFNFFRIENYKL